ncbi:MAG: hypothetical protein MUP99_10990, partial [Pedobacter sp.]|nr:hypothetical protein [Pedobacter sp.]
MKQIISNIMLKGVFIFTVFVSCSSTVSAQEFRLSGVVMETSSTNRIALAEITNKRNCFTVGSNDLGLFQIKASTGDTLVVVKRGFSDKQIVVLSNRDMIIYLSSGTNLNEVNI